MKPILAFMLYNKIVDYYKSINRDENFVKKLYTYEYGGKSQVLSYEKSTNVVTHIIVCYNIWQAMKIIEPHELNKISVIVLYFDDPQLYNRLATLNFYKNKKGMNIKFYKEDYPSTIKDYYFSKYIGNNEIVQEWLSEFDEESTQYDQDVLKEILVLNLENADLSVAQCKSKYPVFFAWKEFLENHRR